VLIYIYIFLPLFLLATLLVCYHAEIVTGQLDYAFFARHTPDTIACRHAVRYAASPLPLRHTLAIACCYAEATFADIDTLLLDFFEMPPEPPITPRFRHYRGEITTGHDAESRSEVATITATPCYIEIRCAFAIAADRIER